MPEAVTLLETDHKKADFPYHVFPNSLINVHLNITLST